jgi:hypothetical protein
VWYTAGSASAQNVAGARIISVDSASYPAVELTVAVTDPFGQGVTGLTAANFTLEEGGRTVPSELLEVRPADDVPAIFTVAVVADLSTSLGEAALAAIRSDLRMLSERLFARSEQQLEFALYVPRSGVDDQQLNVLPFSDNRDSVLQAIDALAPREGTSSLYNAVVAAINSAADRAALRGGPAYVVVLSDGFDTSSIVGAGEAGASEAAASAEARKVQVFTLGYGRAISEASTTLAQLSDRTGATYTPDPDENTLAGLSARFARDAAGGFYHIAYESDLPDDGAAYPLLVRAQFDALNVQTTGELLVPQDWAATRPLTMTVQLNPANFPELQLQLRPVNRLRRTLPTLSSADLRLTLAGEPMSSTLRITRQALAADDPAATQSVALVIDTVRSEDAQLRMLATDFLRAETTISSQVALFLAGQSSSDTFTSAREPLIAALDTRFSSITAPTSDGLAATLLLAIESVARDADLAQRPAYLVLFTSQELPVEEQGRALSLARDRGVMVMVITPAAAIQPDSLRRLATGTEGQLLAGPIRSAMTALAQQIAADSADTYQLNVALPLLADGVTREFTLGLGELTYSATLPSVIDGPPLLRGPPYPALQLTTFAIAALLLSTAALLPQRLRERRLRCPSCGRIRRASWGATCLFCEYDALATPVSSAVLLEGFAAEGAARQRGQRTPMPQSNSPATERTHDTSLSHTAFWGPLPSEATTGRKQARRAPTNAQENSDTAFWGPLPPEEEPPEPAYTDFWGALPEKDKPE